jgi:hypothetical protein
MPQKINIELITREEYIFSGTWVSHHGHLTGKTVSSSRSSLDDMIATEVFLDLKAKTTHGNSQFSKNLLVLKSTNRPCLEEKRQLLVHFWLC